MRNTNRQITVRYVKSNSLETLIDKLLLCMISPTHLQLQNNNINNLTIIAPWATYNSMLEKHN